MGAHSHAYVTKVWDNERILKASPQMPITRTLQPRELQRRAKDLTGMPTSARLILIAGPFLILTGVGACSGPGPSPPVKDAQAHRGSSSTGTSVSEISLPTTKAVILK
jgi:hypothetical protein